MHGGALYVGGLFNSAGSVNAKNVAKWTGNSWQSLGAGLNGEVRALASFQTKVFAGGDFTKSGARNVSGIARFSGGKWREIRNDSTWPEGVNRQISIRGPPTA